jgi:hypothetical protein
MRQKNQIGKAFVAELRRAGDLIGVVGANAAARTMRCAPILARLAAPSNSHGDLTVSGLASFDFIPIVGPGGSPHAN